jgi:methylated-DNA-[protein]-cysteine S-methyltransferase
MFYQIIKDGKDEIGLVWEDAGGKPQVESIYLPGIEEKMMSRIVRDFPAIHKIPRTISNGIDQMIIDLYNGKKRNLDLSILNLSRLTEFSAKVLKQTYRIPHGKVVTYSGLAAKVGNPHAARAVGTALANNPFPIIIPCHRVVRADGRPGQFGGGSEMKKQLLEKEGLSFDKQGMVPLKYIHQ